MTLEAAVGGTARGLCLVAAATLAMLMMSVTVVDVGLRWFGAGIGGAYEIVTLGLRILVPLAFPYAFWTGSHVVVEIVVQRFPQHVQKALIRVGMALGTLAMMLVTWGVFERALTIARSGEVTTDLQLPLIYHWVPLILGSALSVPVTLYLTLRDSTEEYGRVPPLD